MRVQVALCMFQLHYCNRLDEYLCLGFHSVPLLFLRSIKMEKRPTRLPRRDPSPWSAVLAVLATVYLLHGVFIWHFNRFDHALPFDLRHHLLSTPSPEHLRNWSAFYTAGSHLAGQGLDQARFTALQWKNFGISDTRIASYDAKLPLPTGQQRLALLKDAQILYEAPLVDDEHSSQTHGFVPAFYAFGANGNVTASYVFANFGSEADYEALQTANVTLSGHIAVVKSADASPYLKLHGLEIRRGTQIANAAKYGLAGVVMYVDPQNDGPIVEANGYPPFPAGPARPRKAIERGTIGNIGRSARAECHVCKANPSQRISKKVNCLRFRAFPSPTPMRFLFSRL